MANLTDMLSKFVTSNTASTSGLGTLIGEPTSSFDHKRLFSRIERTQVEAKTVKSSIDEPPEVKLKDLPPYLEYAFLEGDDKLPVIITKDLKTRRSTPYQGSKVPQDEPSLKTLPISQGVVQSLDSHK
ncbi:hypothetical protein Tco_0551825 [Tanacetum coccineum]